MVVGWGAFFAGVAREGVSKEEVFKAAPEGSEFLGVSGRNIQGSGGTARAKALRWEQLGVFQEQQGGWCSWKEVSKGEDAGK